MLSYQTQNYTIQKHEKVPSVNFQLTPFLFSSTITIVCEVSGNSCMKIGTKTNLANQFLELVDYCLPVLNVHALGFEDTGFIIRCYF